ncbi:MAG: hypothetical protein LRY26_00675 [Bacilli bacterium]|nr:hypothetical protein [Bacilli bacterium]
MPCLTFELLINVKLNSGRVNINKTINITIYISINPNIPPRILEGIPNIIVKLRIDSKILEANNSTLKLLKQL